MSRPSTSRGELDPFEQDVQAMLRRQATSVRSEPPDWDTLTERPPNLYATPQVPSNWTRPLAAAASLVAVVALGAVVVGELQGGSQAPDTAPASEELAGNELIEPGIGIGVAAPGSEGFDRNGAAPFYPTLHESQVDDLDTAELRHLAADPVTVARDYLAEVGLSPENGAFNSLEAAPVEDSVPEDDRPGAQADDVEDLSVAWSTWAESGPAMTSGHVYLRRGPTVTREDATLRPWLVVGARTEGINVREVRRDDESLSFTVSRTSDTSGIRSVRIEVDGEMVASDIPPQAGLPVRVDVDGRENAVIQVQHLAHPEGEAPDEGDSWHDDAVPVSVFQMVIPHPDEAADVAEGTAEEPLD